MLHVLHENRRNSARLLDYLAAACIGAAGYLHYCLYIKGYRTIPTIGTGFLVQFVTSGVAALALAAPLGFRIHAGRLGVSGDVAARLAGLGLSVGTLVAFLLSRLPGGLFNFREIGLQPAPQSLLTVLTEGVAGMPGIDRLVPDSNKECTRIN